MEAVYGTGIDTRGTEPRLLAGGTSEHWGPGVYYSDDLGATWTEAQAAPVRFPSELGSSVERVWQIQPAGAADPDVVYAGTEPSALFFSEDRGESFTLIRSLWDHPHRAQWQPGGGGQAIHTVLPDPTDAGHVTVAMSTGGVYRTYDRGETWNPANAGIKVKFAPDPFPEFGQCVHKIAAHPTAPNRIFAQNHGGSTAPTMPATNGFRSPMACRVTSDSRLWSIRISRRLCLSFRWPQTSTVFRRRARRGSGAPMMPVRRGRHPNLGCQMVSMPRSCAMP